MRTISIDKPKQGQNSIRTKILPARCPGPAVLIASKKQRFRSHIMHSGPRPNERDFDFSAAFEIAAVKFKIRIAPERRTKNHKMQLRMRKHRPCPNQNTHYAPSEIYILYIIIKSTRLPKIRGENPHATIAWGIAADRRCDRAGRTSPEGRRGVFLKLTGGEMRPQRRCAAPQMTTLKPAKVGNVRPAEGKVIYAGEM